MRDLKYKIKYCRIIIYIILNYTISDRKQISVWDVDRKSMKTHHLQNRKHTARQLPLSKSDRLNDFREMATLCQQVRISRIIVSYRGNQLKNLPLGKMNLWIQYSQSHFWNLSFKYELQLQFVTDMWEISKGTKKPQKVKQNKMVSEKKNETKNNVTIRNF